MPESGAEVEAESPHTARHATAFTGVAVEPAWTGSGRASPQPGPADIRPDGSTRLLTRINLNLTPNAGTAYPCNQRDI